MINALSFRIDPKTQKQNPRDDTLIHSHDGSQNSIYGCDFSEVMLDTLH